MTKTPSNGKTPPHRITPVDENFNEVEEPVEVNGAEITPTGGFGQKTLDEISSGMDVGELDAVRPKADAPHLDVGRVRAQFDIVGERRHAWWRNLYDAQKSTTSTTWSKLNPSFMYGFIESPAGSVPVLRIMVDISNNTSGQVTTFKLTTDERESNGKSPFIQVATDGGTGTQTLYGEAYLNEYASATAIKKNMTKNRLEGYLKVSGGTGKLYEPSMVGLDYEVI